MIFELCRRKKTLAITAIFTAVLLVLGVYMASASQERISRASDERGVLRAIFGPAEILGDAAGAPAPRLRTPIQAEIRHISEVFARGEHDRPGEILAAYKPDGFDTPAPVNGVDTVSRE